MFNQFFARIADKSATTWRSTINKYLWPIFFSILILPSQASAFSADRVWMEFRSNGRFRVIVHYTVPELKQARIAHAEFSKKKDAERLFFDLVRGVDFYLGDASKRIFTSGRGSPQPW